MSVQSADSRIQYVGNASTVTPYAVPFYFFENGDLRVVVTNSAGVDTTLTLGTDFSATGAGNESGGSITTTAAIPNTSRVTIFRQVAMTQSTVYEENSDFPAKSHERALDRSMMVAQQNSRDFGRSIKVRESDGDKSEFAAVANSVIGFGGDSQPRTFTPAQLAVWLNLTQQFFGEGTKTWLADADRVAAVPDFLGQVGVQLDNASLWVANGTSAGSWTDPVPGIADGAISTVMLASGILSADSTGRAKMADAFITLAKIGSGIFTADSTGRGKFASGFVDSGLCASGLWNAIAPAGTVLQTVSAYNNSTSSTTALFPWDNTKPQFVSGGSPQEGTQVLSASITPSSTSNKIVARYHGFLSTPTGGGAHAAAGLWRVGNSDALIMSQSVQGSESCAIPISFEFIDSPASTAEQTYSVRVGAAVSSYTVYINRFGVGLKYDGTLANTLVLQEIKG